MKTHHDGHDGARHSITKSLTTKIVPDEFRWWEDGNPPERALFAQFLAIFSF
jgi:hypothetical protein